ncbi:hypothetical protein TBR22_A07520 [Luteitalea sp. TBR-22]|nr:hypothetical protein TBR22_A07520 [Luteitalea sp. TBR-22]
MGSRESPRGREQGLPIEQPPLASPLTSEEPARVSRFVSRLPTPDSRLPTPDSRLPTPDSRLPF